MNPKPIDEAKEKHPDLLMAMGHGAELVKIELIAKIKDQIYMASKLRKKHRHWFWGKTAGHHRADGLIVGYMDTLKMLGIPESELRVMWDKYM